MEPFQGKVAVVTGGASGIGRMLREELAGRSAVVVVADINEGGAREVASSICGQGGQAQAQSVDVSSEEDVRRLVRDSAAAHGRLDYMFNNAGIVITGDISACSRLRPPFASPVVSWAQRPLRRWRMRR